MRSHSPLALALACALAWLSLAGCGSASTAHAVPAAARPEATEVVRVLSKPLDTTIRLNGDLLPYASVAVFARVSAFVASVAVDRGSRVHKGQRLATLVAPELAARRAEAEATASASRNNAARLEQAAKTPGTVAGNELEAAAAAAASVRAKVTALAALEQYLNVEAPFDGVITERNADPGALVGPGSSTPMLRLEEQKKLRLTVPVPEPLTSLVVDGATVPFTVRSRPGETFRGTIRRLSGSIDLRTRTMAVELDVDNADGKLAPGMFAELTWPVRRDVPSVFVPATAVVDTAERTFVVKVIDGVLTQVPVRRGWTMDDRVEVFGELVQGDLVVRHASDENRTGTSVLAVREVQ